MTTLSNVVIETYQRAMSSLREEKDTLGDDVTIGATSLSIIGTTGSIAAGGIVEVDYELFSILNVAGINNPTVTVSPGYYDSTSAPHLTGAEVLVNPRFPKVDIIKAVNETLDSLSSPSNGLFQAEKITMTFNPVLVGYDFTDANTGVPVAPADVIDLIEVRVHEYGPFNKWPVIPLSELRVNRAADSGSFPSGIGLEFMGGGYPGRPINVLYKAPYTSTLALPGDDVESVTGLHSQAHDLLSLGAVTRLVEWRELKRSFTENQSEPRKAQEVPVGSSLTAMKSIQARFDLRVGEERARLARQYPVRWR